MILEAAIQKYLQDLGKEQELLMNIADMIIETYVAESVQLRVEKLIGIRGEIACKEHFEMMQVYIYDAADKIAKAGKEAINSFASSDERIMFQNNLKRFTKVEDINATAARRNIANRLIEKNKYCS